MALKLVLDTLDGVPADVSKEYVEKDGKFHLDIEGGVKTQADVDKVSEALRKERADHTKAKASLHGYQQLGTPDEIQAQLGTVEELKIAAEGKIDNAKIDKIVEGRLATKLAPVQRELDQTKVKLSETEKAVEGYKTTETTRKIVDSVRGAATKSKVRDTAVADIEMAAASMLTVDESGSVVTRDNVGVTPGVSAEVWLTDMQSKRPHWWPDSAGGGAGGNFGTGAAGPNPFTRENWNMTQQGMMLKADPARAAQMAKAAGTEIGAGMPPPKAK